LRSGLGAALGFGLAWLFGLVGTSAAIATIGAAAPIGFTAVVLSAREELDLDLAASAAAISVFLGSLWIPLVLLLL
jgi:predicted permease